MRISVYNKDNFPWVASTKILNNGNVKPESQRYISSRLLYEESSVTIVCASPLNFDDNWKTVRTDQCKVLQYAVQCSNM